MALDFADTDTDIFSVGAPTGDGVPMFGGLKKKIPGLDEEESGEPTPVVSVANDTDNIFATPVPVASSDDFTATEDIVATTPQAIVESGTGTKSDSGTDTTTTAPTSTNIPNIYDPNVIGADGGATPGAGNVLRTDITYTTPSGFQPEGPAGRGIYVSPDEAGQLGLGGGRTSVFDPGALLPTDRTAGGANVPIFNLGGTTPSAGVVGQQPGSGINKDVVTDTETGATTNVSFDQILNEQISREQKRLQGLGISTSDPEYGAALERAGLRAVDIYEVATKEPIKTGMGPTTPLTRLQEILKNTRVMPLPVSPEVAAAITLILNRGAIGQAVGDIFGGGGTGGGGGAGAGPGAGGTVQIRTPTQEDLDALEQERVANEQRRAEEEEERKRQQQVAAIALGEEQKRQQAAAAAAAAARQQETQRQTDLLMGVMGDTAARRQAQDLTENPPDDDQNPDDTTIVVSCPSPETPILLPDLSTIPAGELKVGMNVLARLENQLIWGGYEVTRAEIVKDQRLKFTFDYGTFICSPTHKFCHNDWEWREAQSYSVGDEIQDHKILAIEDDGVGDVVVITVDEAHTYVAGPFLSHNKTPLPPVTEECPEGQEKVNGQCVAKCPTGQTRNAQGVCVVTPRPPEPEPECPQGQERVNGTCVPKCPTGYQRNAAGVCVVIPTPSPPVTPTPTPTPTPGSTFNVTIPVDTTPITYTAPKAGDPFQRYSWEEASSQLGMLNTPVGQRIIGYQKDASGKDVPVYSRVPLDEEGNPLTVGGAITGEYGKMAGGMTQADIKRLRDTFGGLIGEFKGPKGEDLTLQQSLTQAAAEQTAAANRALRAGNLADAAEFAMKAQGLRDKANAGLFGEAGTLPQYTQTAQSQVARDIEALRAAERGELSRESLRAAQQAAREAASARGQVMSRGAMAQEVLNREAAIQQRQQQARQNLAQSMGQLGQGIGFQTANVFDPMAATLGQQYGMQTTNVGLNQALYNQGMGLASGQGGYGFAQQMVNPFSQYAADVYGTNVNARNAFMIQEANRLAALEAARMGEAAARNAANTKLALGGVDFLYKYGMGKGWWE